MKHPENWLRKAMTALVVLVFLAQMAWAAPNEMVKDKFDVAKAEDQIDDQDALEGTYYIYAKESENWKSAAEDIILRPADATRTDGKEPVVRLVTYPGEEQAVEAIIWDDAAEGYQWQVEIPEDALYQIDFRYVATEENVSLLYGIQIDGEAPFKESDSVKLRNAFSPTEEVKENEYGDELPGDLQHVEFWQTYSVYDLDGVYSMPLQYRLTKGTHTVTMQFKSGTLALAEIRLAIPDAPPSYEEYAASSDAPAYDGETLRLEAEASDIRSRKSLNTEASNDPSVSPYEVGRDRQNVLYGWNYRLGNDEITWTVNVPQDGKYKFALRVWQNYYAGSVVYRQLRVDGEIPFREAEAVALEGTGKDFQVYTLGGEETPYLLNLTKGEHTITLRATLGELKDVYYTLTELNSTLNTAIKDIQTITGNDPDENFNYHLEEKAPWILEDVRTVYEGLLEQAEILEKQCNKTSELVTTIRSYAGDLKNMVNKPRLLTKQMSNLTTVQGQIGNWISNLKDSPLQMDYIELLAADEEPVAPKASFWTKVRALFADFLNSFRSSEGGAIASSDPDTLEVWTSREREYGEIIQRMAEQSFTPQTGIKIRMNILGSGSVGVNSTSPLMLALVSGESPDVVMGSDQGTPVELAIRNSGFDLTQFEDFDEVTSRFPEGAVVPFRYKGGTYALPETLDFNILLYRTDVLRSAGLDVPNTWNELTAKTLPTLRQYNMNFALNATANKSAAAASDNAFYFMMAYLQRGGRLYTEDGLNTTLNSDLAFQSFKWYTDLYLQYDVAYGQNFFNQFSIGKLPLAVGGLYDYLQLDVAAPGISGKWDIAPLPGTVQEDGTINRSCCGTVTSALIFDQNGKQDKAWEFLKWWTSEEVQIEFSNEIEAVIGSEARWFSANSNALLQLQWTENGKDTIEEMLQWYDNMPNILGSYMTNRSITNAFNRVVLQRSQKPRDAVEQAYKEIQAEILRKNREYGVIE